MGLLDLPPEIRNQIYVEIGPIAFKGHDNTMLYHMDAGSVVREHKWHTIYSPALGSHKVQFPLQPSIAMTCKQIRRETLAMFYGANSFVIIDDYWYLQDGINTPFPAALLNCFSQLKAYLPLMTSVEIKCGRPNAQRAHEVVYMLTDLDLGFREGALKAAEF